MVLGKDNPVQSELPTTPQELSNEQLSAAIVVTQSTNITQSTVTAADNSTAMVSTIASLDALILR